VNGTPCMSLAIFMQDEALKKFRERDGWKAGVDGSVALVALGAGGTIDTTKLNDPIVGFVFGQKGLMYNLTLEGSKFSKIDKSVEQFHPVLCLPV
jgi:lipid-binding SYLF domain-containing protein